MAFSKTFPKTTDKSAYPRWIEVAISDEEEKAEDERCRQDNLVLMKGCIEDAKKVMEGQNLKKYQTDLISIAISLFEKRASHSVHYKESACKKRFDEKYP